MMDAIYPTSGGYGLGVFLLVTMAMGGSAAWATGRAIAATWRPAGQVLAYGLLLAAVARFLQYALFHQPLLAPGALLIDALILIAIGLASYRATRAGQMAAQYGFAFERNGMFGWRARLDTATARRQGSNSP